MTDAANVSFTRAFDRARLERVADWLAVAVVVALPWSTSAALDPDRLLASRARADAEHRRCCGAS